MSFTALGVAHAAPQPSDDVTVYVVLNDYGKLGIA
jgi:hypothetical protein